MTLREAVIQAQLELGVSPENVELNVKASTGFIPDAAPLVDSPVKPGLEREFIEMLKQLFRKMDANPQAYQAALRNKMAERTKAN